MNPALSRRSFLRLAGLAALSSVAGCATRPLRPVSAPGPSPTPASFSGTPDAEIVLTARETPWELAPGKVIRAWAYNDTVPGPAIRLREGQRVRVILRNELPEPTTVHWHGVDVPAAMDGVPDVSQPAIRPGETFVYEFEARPAGTRWYHTHFNSARQLDLGLAAPFIIEPATGDALADREYTLVLDDWLTGSPPPDEAPSGGGMMGGMMRRMMGGDEPVYDTFTINGKAFPATAALPVKPGERVRLRLINASSMQTFVVRLAGHRLQVTHTDGNPLQTPVEVDAVPIAPAERYDVVFVASHPGRWPLYALDRRHTAGGLQTHVVYEGFEAAPESPETGGAGRLGLWSYGLGEGIDVLPPAASLGRSYALTLSGGMMMAPDRWTINGRTYPHTGIPSARADQLVAVQLSNMSMQAHPFHLHGQSFRLLAINGRRLSVPLIKDTVDVPAMMGTVDLEFVAFNPGRWLFHCHKPMHMDGGMATLVMVQSM